MFDENAWGVIWLAVIVLLVGMLIIAAALALPFIGVGAVLLGGTVAYYRSPFYQEKQAKKRTYTLYETAKKLNPISSTEFGVKVISGISELDAAYTSPFLAFALAIYHDEEFGEPEPPPPVCNTVEAARYRDRLNAYMANVHSTRTADLAIKTTEQILADFWRHAPELPEGEHLTTVPLASLLDDLPERMEEVMLAFFDEEIEATGLFKRLRDRLNRNFNEQGGLYPRHYKGDNILWDYFKDTPILELFQIPIPLALPQATRFEHMHVVAGTGHGKTQTLQYLISRDINADCSIVVMDSQRDLIKNIAQLDIPKERIVLIDPSDIEYPVALNMFDVGMDRINRYSPVDRERMINGIIELYDFVLGSLLDAEMTQKQSTLFRYVTRLMLHIPDATIHTLVDVLRPGATERYAKYIDELPETARMFFKEEFVKDSKAQYGETKDQVVRRLYGILENQTFERMFSNPRNKVDIFKAMNDGKIILIDTSKDLLKDDGTKLLGRFFLALIAQAAQERATLSYKRPTFVFIDEVQDYLEGANEQSLDAILSQCRRQNIGLVLAHQFLGQLPSRIDSSISANVAIRFAGGVSPEDARTLAGRLRTSADFILGQKKGQFAAYIRGVTETATTLTIPFGVMEGMAQRDDFHDLIDYTREHYAVPADKRPKSETVKELAEDAPSCDEPKSHTLTATPLDLDNPDTTPSDRL